LQAFFNTLVDPNTLLHDTNVFGVVRMVIKNQKDTHSLSVPILVMGWPLYGDQRTDDQGQHGHVQTQNISPTHVPSLIPTHTSVNIVMHI
jgi:hypothetical protein